MANGSWQLTGNAGTDPASNFVGTTDGKPLSIKATGITLDLTENGGGQLVIANNAGDNRVWMEAWGTANGSATELLLTGQDGQNVPTLSLCANFLGVRSKEIILGLQSAGGGVLRIGSILMITGFFSRLLLLMGMGARLNSYLLVRQVQTCRN